MIFLKEFGFPISTLRTIGAWICNYIYMLISYVFELFLEVANHELLSSDDIRPIYQRVTIVLAIIMVFYVTFEFVKYVVQPDTMTDKEKGASKVISKMLVVVVLIAFVPTIFSYAYKLQYSIIDKEVLSKVILGQYQVPAGKRGANFSANMFSMFYYFDANTWGDNADCDGPSCQTIVDMNINSLRNGKGMPNLMYKINEAEELQVEGLEDKNNNSVSNLTEKITFRGLWAVAVGLFILYILVMYVVDVGARVIYLAFLQIIAPIPIISYLSPKKDGMFQKWVKQCISTYLDVFIRLAIIYFILFICNLLLNSSSLHELKFDLVTIALVLGLLLFAQKAPKLLQELFPKMGTAVGSFGLKPGERFKAAGRAAGMGAGAVVGAAAGIGTGIAQGARRARAAKARGDSGFRQVMSGAGGALMGTVRGATGGLIRGAYNGTKKGNVLKNSIAGAKKQVESNKQFGNRQENGYTFGHQLEDRARGSLGFKSRIQERESEKKPIENKMKINNDIFSAFKAVKDEAKKHAIEEGKGRYSAEYKMAAQKVHDLRENGAAKNGYVIGATINGRRLNTQKDVDDEYGKALANADKDLDAAEKKAIYDFLHHGEWNGKTYTGYDQQVLNLQHELQNKITEYNGAASAGLEANEVTFESDGTIRVSGVSYDSVNNRFIEVPPGSEIPMTPKEFNDWTKTLTKDNATKWSGQIAEINAEINKIKDETDGSGIGEKKS